MGMRKRRVKKMSCSVKTGVSGSNGKLRKIRKNVSLGSGETQASFPFSSIFNEITPVYVGIESVKTQTGGDAQNIQVNVESNQITLSTNAYYTTISVIVFALY